ncbi:MAG: MoaD/ThiS family protein [Gammaproteobacteria bacterium]
MPVVYIHPSLQRLVEGNLREFKFQELKKSELFPILFKNHPQLKAALASKSGGLNQYVNVYINGKHSRHFDDDHKLEADDQVEIVTSLVGG